MLSLLLIGNPALGRDYHFNGSMSEPVLRNYLSRSMTAMYLLFEPLSRGRGGWQALVYREPSERRDAGGPRAGRKDSRHLGG